MSDQIDAPKSKRPRHAGMFKPGASGNPRGRPPSGLALAERIREKVDPDQLIAIALELATDITAPLRDRLAAVTFFAERGWIKPPAQLEIEASVTPRAGTLDLTRLPLDEQRRLLDAIRTARRALPSGDDGEPA